MFLRSEFSVVRFWLRSMMAKEVYLSTGVSCCRMNKHSSFSNLQVPEMGLRNLFLQASEMLVGAASSRE